MKETIGVGTNLTGVQLRNGYLYVASPTEVIRYKMTPGQLKPGLALRKLSSPACPNSVCMKIKASRSTAKAGSMSARRRTLQRLPVRRIAARRVPGQDPCPLLEEHGGIWKFDENKLNQKQSDGVKFATGLRQMPAITWHDGALWVTMNNRDQLDTLWGTEFSTEENADRPAEPMYKIQQGDNFGWPLLLLRLRAAKTAPQSGIRRRWQNGRPLLGIQDADRLVPRPLGSSRYDFL